jgi:class 3 adenylate cyclase/tetratricopeptide (TPR) repeat protein
VRCSKCGSDNREGRKFCTNCGSSFIASCPKCGAAIQPGEKFCGECGTALGGVPAPKPHEALEASPTGERRHLTVLFCDLVGSTEIAARLDPEDWRETLAAYHRAAADAVTRYGGHVAQYLGDGVMAFFGYPEAHDNDAERAVWAGLAMLDIIAKLGGQPDRPKLAARVGIDSGAVVVGAGVGKEVDVFGETPNIAARVQAAAEPGTVLITDAVHRLISGLFVVESRSAPALKGIERPLQLYKIVQPSGMRGWLEATAAVRGLTPFVGREDELRLLMNRWERALEGEGQVVLIIGEAGIGKSRLLQRFYELLIPDASHAWIEAAAAPFFQNTPFYAIAELLRELVAQASLTEVETDGRLAQLESALLMAGLKPAEVIPLIAPLLNLQISAEYPLPPISPQQQRRRLLAMLVEWMLGATRAQPLIIALEDLHWADASTLEVVQLLVEQEATAHLLLLCTARPEFHPQWLPRAHHAQINLNRLSARNVREMINQVAARHVLTGETVDTVIERTGGVPLFVEELTRTVLESGSAKLAEREIPVTLHDSLMARLDRLGPAKEVIQIGAVIGAEFSYELLHAVHPVGAEALQGALRSMTDAELVHMRGLAPEATYRFKHALIRDAAYEALLKSRRRELHRLVAQTVDQKFTALAEAQPEVLAHHWTQAGETELAMSQWAKAGKAAEARHAFHEAQENYQQALALLNLLPESSERDSRELQFRQSLVSMLHVTRGWAAAETVAAAERMGMLAEKSGNLGKLITSMTTRCLHVYIAGEISLAEALADQGLELAQRQAHPTALAYLHMLELTIRYNHGDLAGAEKYFTTGLKFFDDPLFRQSPNGGVINVFGTAAWNAWMLGRADVASDRIAKMRATVNPANPHDQPWSEGHAAILHNLMRKNGNEQATVLAVQWLKAYEHRFPNEAAFARCLLGIMQARLGRTTDGIVLIREGIAGLLKAGNRISVTLYINNLIEAQNLNGDIAEALDTVEQALQFNPEELVNRPETLRLGGELRLQCGQAELAEADFRDSIAMARPMGAKAWELRTTMSLARMLEKQGRGGEAYTTLAEIYNWFTEGFDTPDLREAKTLLDELAT